MAGRIRAATPIGSCPDCLSWGASYGSQSFCRACYDFTRRYQRGQCGGCRRVIAVKKGHCRLCWLQAGIAAAGRRRITPGDFSPAGYWQLSLAGMSRLGGTGPAPLLPAAPVPEQTRPRPVAEPGGRAEPASVNDPSPAVCRTDIGHWPVTSSTGHVWITIWCRYGRDRLPDLPAGHQAAGICAGKWRTGRPGADPGTPPGVAPPSWVLAQFIHKLVHSPLHSRPHQGWRDRSAAVHAGPGSREGFSCRPAVPRLAPVPSARDQPCAVQGKATMQERALELRHEPGG